ncbi:MAG: hypothetical protein EXR71_01375 [Myxococcales bacterium]|nr:hypothetical protein [Myxococcales bacterium]
MTPSATYSSEVNESVPSSESDDEFMLRRRRHRKHGEAIEGLNLTAMMDIMTIILVFLIKQYESSPQNITLSDDLTPPKTTSEAEMVPAVALTIAKTSILVDNKLVVKVVAGTALTSEDWAKVRKALGVRRDQIRAIGAAGGAKFDGNIMLIADDDTPYEIISDALLGAGAEQYTTYRLVLQAGGRK